jgi:vancomycin permeability regulator SanA
MSFFQKRTWFHFLILLAGLVLLFFIVCLPYLIVASGHSMIREMEELNSAPVAIVFGAGLTSHGSPSDALSDRLHVAALLYENHLVERLLVSGDNSSEDYSEPDVMKETLMVDYQIPEEDIFADYAGRRTYDTCIRAHELWGIDRAILVTQDYHLPRALWTCQRLGVDAEGISASLQPYLEQRWYHVREMLASFKAFFDIYLWHPDYLGGDFLVDLDP